jgi:hypothetical protein
METVYTLYALNLFEAGGQPLPGDTLRGLLAKWVIAEGGTYLPGDSKNDMLHELAAARGVATALGDSNVLILRKISGGGQADGEWQCLQLILAATGIVIGAFTAGEAYDITYNASLYGNFKIDFTAATGADSYRFETSLSADFSVIDSAENIPSGLTLAGTINDVFSDLYVRVFAFHSSDPGNYSVSNTVAIPTPF